MTESQASEHVRNRQWQTAKEIYDQLLSESAPGKLSKERTIACLYGRTECCLELKEYESVAQDCHCLLKLLAQSNESRASGSASPVPSSASSTSSSSSSSTTNQQNPTATTESKVRKRLIHSLYKQQKYAEAEVILQEWAANHNYHQDINRYLERLKSVLQMASANSSPTPALDGAAPAAATSATADSDSSSSQGPSTTPTSTISSLSSLNFDTEYEQIETKLENLIINNLPPDRYTKQLNQLNGSSENKSSEREAEAGEAAVSNGSAESDVAATSSEKAAAAKTDEGETNESAATTSASSNGSTVNNFQKQLDKISNISCVYCTMNFADRSELRAHCQTQSHQNIIMSDEGRDWKWRPPPRGFTAESYSLCENYADNQSCHYGNQCVEAHGVDELNEWKERFEYRKKKLQRARDKELYGKSYTEQLLERWVQAPSPDKVMKERVEGVEEACSQDLVTTVSSKVSKREWTFVLKTRRLLKAVALLQDAHRNHFIIKQIYPGEPRAGRPAGNKVVEAELTSDQEWVAPMDAKVEPIEPSSPLLEHRVKVVFNTDIYGTFRQAVVFDFGSEPVLVKHICVDVVPVTEVD